MDSAEAGNEKQPTKLDIQVGLIVAAYREKGIEVGVARFPDGSLDFLYHLSVILVRDPYLEAVAEVVGGGERRDGLLPGISVYSLDNARISGVLEALEEIDERLGEGVATPVHILSVTPVFACPATEPEEVSSGALPDPGVCDGGGAGVLIHAPDTGLVKDAHEHSWLAGVTGQQDPPPGTSGATIPAYSGHGTFVAGMARCMAPVSQVRVTRDFDRAGALSEHEIAVRLRQALGQGADIISLSAGGTTRKNLPPLSFEAFWDTYRHYKGVVLVASAGNNSTRRPFWPAAFPQVVSVGALAADGRARAHFSDFGPWVDVYAPGEGLVNAYATGTYICHEPPHVGQVRHFEGMARWSGTSFSAPLVSGLIASRASRTGENARQAASALLALAREHRLPGVGPVLWPCHTGDSGRGCDPGRGCGCGGCGCGCCGSSRRAGGSSW